MKRISLLMVCAFVLLGAACNNAKKENATQEAQDSTAVKSEVIVPDTTHNAQNSLDVNGTYEGTLPSASGPGMKVVITLADSTYKKSVTYAKEPKKTFDSEGAFTWDNGTIITLQGEKAPQKYFVGENTLTQLDTEGNKITGELADQYILRKK